VKNIRQEGISKTRLFTQEPMSRAGSSPAVDLPKSFLTQNLTPSKLYKFTL
jgi:hypothetical protein